MRGVQVRASREYWTVSAVTRSLVRGFPATTTPYTGTTDPKSTSRNWSPSSTAGDQPMAVVEETKKMKYTPFFLRLKRKTRLIFQRYSSDSDTGKGCMLTGEAAMFIVKTSRGRTIEGVSGRCGGEGPVLYISEEVDVSDKGKGSYIFLQYRSTVVVMSVVTTYTVLTITLNT